MGVRVPLLALKCGDGPPRFREIHSRPSTRRNPAYEVLGGSAMYNSEELLGLDPEVRAQKGIFLAFRYPVEIPGVTNAYFLRFAYDEILKMAVLQPKLEILDETDSGLDIDALRIVAGGVNGLRRPDNATIVVIHYQRLLNYIVPDFVHVLANGMRIRTARERTRRFHLRSARREGRQQAQAEIYADDVKCTHGATNRPVDSTALFYPRAAASARPSRFVF